MFKRIKGFINTKKKEDDTFNGKVFPVREK